MAAPNNPVNRTADNCRRLGWPPRAVASIRSTRKGGSAVNCCASLANDFPGYPKLMALTYRLTRQSTRTQQAAPVILFVRLDEDRNA